MTRALKILEFLRFSEKLKTQLRDNKKSCGNLETVADHSWQLALMVLLVEEHLKTKVDVFKTLKMALIHDLVEAEIGDVPYAESRSDPKIKAQKDVLEKKEIEKIKILLGGFVGDELYDLWHEYELRETKEAKLLKALDSLEADFQALCFGKIDWWDDFYYDVALTKSGKHCSHESILMELNEEIIKRIEVEMKNIGLDVEAIKFKSLDK